MAQVNVRNRKKKDGSNNWEYRFEAAPVDGKRKQISKSGFTTKKAALDAGIKALAEYNQAGSRFEPTEMSVADYLDYWMKQYVEVSCKHSTIASYRNIIENRIKPWIGQYRLRSLTSHMLQELITDKYLHSDLSKSSLSSTFGIINTALDYAVEPYQFIQSNPMISVKAPKLKNPRSGQSFRRCIPKAEIDTIFERLDGTIYYLAIAIGYHTGMRISEVYGLTWDDIDFDNRVIHVNKQSYNIGRKWFLGSLKTKSSERDIIIGTTLLNVLKRYKRTQNEHMLEYGEYYIRHYLNKDGGIVSFDGTVPVDLPECDLIMRKKDGGYSSTSSFKYAARIIHFELGYPEWNYHSLRHTHATMLVESNANIKAIQQRLGHAHVNTTLNVYSHCTEDMTSDCVDRFENMISGGHMVDKTS